MKLTREEIFIVVFILAALVLGSVVKHYRPRAPAPAEAQADAHR